MNAVVRSRAGQQRRSRAARARILAAATRLFVRDGYLATTMAAIAGEAGVAVQSLYLRFGSKLAILSDALDVAIVGDEEPMPLLDRPWVQKVADCTDGPEAMQVLLAQTRQICERSYPIYAALRSAASTEAGELLADNRRQRYSGLGPSPNCSVRSRTSLLT
jgi:AcrR family transcriptional regulator